MKALLKSFKIDEKLTRPRLEKQPVYNQFKNNIPRIEDYNFIEDYQIHLLLNQQLPIYIYFYFLFQAFQLDQP